MLVTRSQQRCVEFSSRTEDVKFWNLGYTGTYSHSGSLPSCAFISRIALPVCILSSCANSGTRTSKERARRDNTPARWYAELRDQIPESKTDCASSTVCCTSAEVGAATLSELNVGHCYCKEFEWIARSPTQRFSCGRISHGEPARL